MNLATIFVNPIPIDPTDAIFWVIPLCIAVAAVYRTIRTDNLRRLPREIVTLSVCLIGGLAALMAILWTAQTLLS
jgi:hypothetical protein